MGQGLQERPRESEKSGTSDIINDVQGEWALIEEGTSASPVFNTLYDGYREYMQKIKGWPCPSREEIWHWEYFKHTIFKVTEAKHGREKLSKL